jgi:NAD(P)-dependent dehydrogenase (short-subunit alcohol dehydrogenase family)
MPTLSFALTDRIVPVIGAASGIGEAVAIGLAQLGARIVALDIDVDGARRVAQRISDEGGHADAQPIDLGSTESVDSALDTIRARRDCVDGVVCTPGVNVRKPLLDYTDDDYDRVVELNLKGSFRVLRAAGRIMVQQRRGSIVLFSSIRSMVVEPGQGVYAATKSGIVQLVRTAAAEFGPAGVRVNAVAPGVVETPLTAPIKRDAAWYQAYASKGALGRWARADEMAGPTAFLISDAASFVTGSVLFADGGWTAVDGRFAPPGMGGEKPST